MLGVDLGLPSALLEIGMHSRALFLICVSFLLTGNVPAGDAPAFPLKISSSGRSLTDQNNVPFFVHGDSPWSMLAQLNKEDTERYLESARKQGFNAIILNLVEHQFSDRAPRNHTGAAPFKTPGDFAMPNEAYFAHADWVLAKTKEKGLLVLLFPAWAAAPKAGGGWNQEILKNGPEKCREYGRFLGRRYRDFPNIIWGHGGDQNPPPDSPMARNLLKILLGIKDQAPRHWHFYHGTRAKTSLDQENFASHVDLDAVYVCDEARGAARVGESHTTSLKSYNREKFRPHFLFEAVYESVSKEKPKWGDPYTSDRARLRRQAYWNVLSGSTGHFFGNYPVWALQAGWDGPGGLGSPGRQDMQYLKTLITRRAWWKLAPDDKHLTVTKGSGTVKEADSVTAARADDGSFVMAYLPSTGTTARTLTVDMSRLRGPATARWFNPADGTYKALADAPLPNTGSQEFTTPGDNGTGANDWVLVLETETKAAPPSKGPGFTDVRVGDWEVEAGASFAVAADEARKILHFVYRSKNALYHALSTDSGTKWTNVGRIVDSAEMPSLAVDSNGGLHLAYTVKGRAGLEYRSYAHGAWSKPVDLTRGIEGGKVTTVASRVGVDGGDNVHILYWSVWGGKNPDWRKGSRAVYCYKPAGQAGFGEPQLWTNGPKTSGGYGKHGALFTDARGNTHLFYLTSDRSAAGKITSAIERRIRRPDGTWHPRHDFWPLKDDVCDWSMAAAIGAGDVVHLSMHRRVSKAGADIVYMNNAADAGVLTEVRNFGFEPWESFTDLSIEPTGDIWLAAGHVPYEPPDKIGPRGGYYHFDAKTKSWSSWIALSETGRANLDNRYYMHPRLVRLQNTVRLFYAEKRRMAASAITSASSTALARKPKEAPNPGRRGRLGYRHCLENRENGADLRVHPRP